MKMTQFISSLVLTLALAAGSAAVAQDALKVGVMPVDGGDELRAALMAGLAEAGYEVIPAEDIDAALGEIEVPDTGIDPGVAVALGEATGAQAIIAGRVIGEKAVAKIFSTKNATVFAALGPNPGELAAKVDEAIKANLEMLLKDPE